MKNEELKEIIKNEIDNGIKIIDEITKIFEKYEAKNRQVKNICISLLQTLEIADTLNIQIFKKEKEENV